MRLVAWRTAKAWTLWHISHLAEPLCGVRIPETRIALADKAAKPSDWARTCAHCKVIALRAATDPAEIDAPTLTLHGGNDG